MALRNRPLANARRTLSRPRLDRLEDRTVPTGWGFSLGGAASDVGDNVDVDPAGNLFVAGYFNGTVDFDPSANQALLSVTGSNNNYLAKYSPQGQFEWARCVGGSSYYPLGSTVDVAGNAYLFSQVVSPATVTITGTGGYVGPSLAPVGTNVDGLITKFSPDGSVVWTRQFGGSAGLIGGYDKELAVGADGSVFAVGQMSAGIADFDPTGMHSGDTDILTFTGASDIFVAKYAADGSFLWARRAGGTESDRARGVAVDSVGNSYMSGNFEGQCDFGPFTLMSRGGLDGFVAKLDSTGAFVWARRMGGTGGENLPDIQVYREPTTGTESIFVGGHFSTNGTPADFGDPTNPIDVGAVSLTSLATDVVVLKLSTAGGFLWTRQLGAADNDVCYGIAVDSGGNVYSTGSGGTMADFDPGPGTAYLPDGRVFVWKLDPAGNYAGARRMGGTIGWGIAADSGGFVYVTGYFTDALMGDTGAGTVALTSSGALDAYVVRINPSPVAVAAVRVNDGTAQRSRISSLAITFNLQVTFNSSMLTAFTLTRNGGGAVGFSALSQVINGVTVVTISDFTGPETQSGSLRDGRYTLTALASQISVGGLNMTANYTFGDAQGLFRYYGDMNGDRRVDISDFGFFSLAYLNPLNYNAALDFNNDGRIDIADFGQFSVRYFTTLP